MGAQEGQLRSWGEEGLGKLPTPNGFQLRPEWAWELLVGVRRGGFLAEGGTGEGLRPHLELPVLQAVGSGCPWKAWAVRRERWAEPGGWSI